VHSCFNELLDRIYKMRDELAPDAAGAVSLEAAFEGVWERIRREAREAGGEGEELRRRNAPSDCTCFATARIGRILMFCHESLKTTTVSPAFAAIIFFLISLMRFCELRSAFSTSLG
jgi:hypothetical protein